MEVGVNVLLKGNFRIDFHDDNYAVCFRNYALNRNVAAFGMDIPTVSTKIAVSFITTLAVGNLSNMVLNLGTTVVMLVFHGYFKVLKRITFTDIPPSFSFVRG